MLDRLARQLGVNTTIAIILLVLVIAQVATQVYALVDLARRDVVRGGRKWVWALCAGLGNLPGAVIYLVVGRKPDRADLASHGASASASDGDAAKRAVDLLYEPRERR